jgi:very-long-chain enoyl-CoA reductase
LSRDGKVLVKFPDPVAIDTTVTSFKKMYNEQLKIQGRKAISEPRMYFTVGSAKGPGLKDKNKTLADYFGDQGADSGVNLYFKDLGPQIAWRTVFLVEYAGPIFITLSLILFRK